MRVPLYVGASLLLATQALGQPVVSQSEFQRRYDSIPKSTGGCGVAIPLGEHNYTTPEGMQGGAKFELGRVVVALKDIGVIQLINMPTTIGFIRFRVALAADVDRSQVIEMASNTCIAQTTGPAELTVVKADAVKGGNTKWDGAIVYFTITKRQLTDLYVKYMTARKREDMLGDLRARALWKYDVFKKDWIMTMSADVGPLNGQFSTDKVISGLAQH
jgi:hypothetical protein